MRLERLAVGSTRDQFLPLFLLADESEKQVRSYYQRGDLFVLRGGDGVVRGLTLAIAQTAEAMELKAIAVPLSMHRRGFGRRMLGLVLDELRQSGVRRVVVGTGNAELGSLTFYQKLGFRLWRIERDFFTAERGYAKSVDERGIPLRDMVWMDRDIE